MARPDVQGLFILNESAALLWSCVKSGMPFADIVDRFCQEYSIPSPQAEVDLGRSLSSWDHDLLSPLRPPLPAQPVLARPPLHEYAAQDYRVNGHAIRVWVSDPEIVEEISPRLEAFQAFGPGKPDLEFHVWTAHGQILLAYNSELVAAEENPNAIRAILLQEMVRHTEAQREWLGVVHAGACGTNTSCILLAGKSHSGKTTLCAALMASGLKFYCDDSAAIGCGDLKISPMPFRMMVREGSLDVLKDRFPGIITSTASERYGQKVRFLAPAAEQVAASASCATAIIFVSFSPGDTTAMRKLDLLATLLRLQESGFWVRHDRESIEAFLGWLQSLTAFTLVYSNLDEAISKVREVSDQ